MLKLLGRKLIRVRKRAQRAKERQAQKELSEEQPEGIDMSNNALVKSA